MKLTSDIISIVRAGGSVVIDSSKLTSDLISIVKSASSNSEIIIKGANKKLTSDLISISKAAGGKKVIFDLTK
ncbi:hypothetical protein AAX29_00568 [Aliarcobacter thereius]|uniref:Uncharacterized protein n=1 Tax=Aliarcobacter thereius TaxID=544718 RepID=A0A1C0B7G7_9BACT|nr:hypothetical protein [Aliarcobacter thereius]OCL99527.1 hypothetical protein AAX29_00568 [Aliarcobacter thereius]